MTQLSNLHPSRLTGIYADFTKDDYEPNGDILYNDRPFYVPPIHASLENKSVNKELHGEEKRDSVINLINKTISRFLKNLFWVPFWYHVFDKDCDLHNAWGWQVTHMHWDLVNKLSPRQIPFLSHKIQILHLTRPDLIDAVLPQQLEKFEVYELASICNSHLLAKLSNEQKADRKKYLGSKYSEP